MSRRPFRPEELEDFETELEPAVEDLERYLADSSADPSAGFADQVMLAVSSQPMPRRGLLASITTAFSGDRGRLALVAATIAAAVLVVVAGSQLTHLLQDQGGNSPLPSVSAPSLAPSVPPSMVPTMRPSRSPEPSPSAGETRRGSSTAEPSEDSGSPQPTGSAQGSDNSGPGGGGGGDGGNSGPGGSSGPSSHSGPGGG